MIAHGGDVTKSYLVSLGALEDEINVRESLRASQQEYFDKRRAEMNDASNPFTALYTFDEEGQLKYREGALAKLSDLSGRNSLTG